MGLENVPGTTARSREVRGSCLGTDEWRVKTTALTPEGRIAEARPVYPGSFGLIPPSVICWVIPEFEIVHADDQSSRRAVGDCRRLRPVRDEVPVKGGYDRPITRVRAQIVYIILFARAREQRALCRQKTAAREQLADVSSTCAGADAGSCRHSPLPSPLLTNTPGGTSMKRCSVLPTRHAVSNPAGRRQSVLACSHCVNQASASQRPGAGGRAHQRGDFRSIRRGSEVAQRGEWVLVL